MEHKAAIKIKIHFAELNERSQVTTGYIWCDSTYIKFDRVKL